jgi:hypothetical protein
MTHGYYGILFYRVKRHDDSGTKKGSDFFASEWSSFRRLHQ